ncbi:MAG: glycosyltransferase family 2 protein [Alistipes sp.]|nr:glycosyltransferase family 2 protein [Alistipes sp.]
MSKILKMITIFTPTYNRAYILPELYESLCRQTYRNFEWVVIDDGSSDETSALFEKWIDNSDFPIVYQRQQNGGKHRAINRAVRIARGELFYIVDSDDRLPADSLAQVVEQFGHVKDDESFAGVCGLKTYFDGTKIGGECDFDILECNALDYRYKYKITGDAAEVIRTEVFREIPFPEIDGEKFCPEAVVWNRIARKYKLRYFYGKIYSCDYLPDGLTAKIVKCRMMSPIASCMCYAELAATKIPFVQRVKAAINYWRFRFCASAGQKPRISIVWYPLLPVGLCMHVKDLCFVK